jgi:hypothetical protein
MRDRPTFSATVIVRRPYCYFVDPQHACQQGNSIRGGFFYGSGGSSNSYDPSEVAIFVLSDSVTSQIVQLSLLVLWSPQLAGVADTEMVS